MPELTGKGGGGGGGGGEGAQLLGSAQGSRCRSIIHMAAGEVG